MKRHKDLVAYLKSRGLRMTASKKLLIQFFLENQSRHVPLRELQHYVIKHLPDTDRTTIYRNIEKFIALDLIQELNLPRTGKVYQFVFNKKVQHYYICKGCSRIKKGDEALFNNIEKAFRDIHGFSKANLSVVFYGHCSECELGANKRPYGTDFGQRPSKKPAMRVSRY